MRIELREIRHSEFASQETHCYQAELYVDGLFFANVGNAGRGGADFMHLARGRTWDEVRALEAHIAETYPLIDIGEGYEPLRQNLETVCGDLVNEWLRRRALERLLRKPLFIDPAHKGVRGFPLPRGIKLVDALQVLRLKHPTYRFLNDLPRDEALALLEKELSDVLRGAQ